MVGRVLLIKRYQKRFGYCQVLHTCGTLIWLVAWNIFSITYGIIRPIDCHIFQDG